VKTEMDIMRMDERQRLHWLKANRATLMVVGAVWLAMIAWELVQDRTPWYLISMVPIFGAVRLSFYWFYARDREVRWKERLVFFVLIGVGHWVATMAAELGEFSTSGIFGLFPEPGHAAWSAAARILGSPLVTITRGSPALEVHAYGCFMILNSVLWAGVISLVVWAIRWRVPSKERAEGGPSG